MKKIIVVFIILLSALNCNASVVFQENFDSWSGDWTSTDDDTLLNANGWSGATIDERTGSFNAAYVNSTGAYGGSGRGFIQYWASTTGAGSAQNIWLNREDTAFPDEYYVGYRYQIDPNWDWGNATRLKIIKTNYNSGETWDMGVWANSWSFGDPTQFGTVDGLNWTGDSDCGFTINTDEQVRKLSGCWNMIEDTAWHYVIMHVVHSTSVMGTEIDGVDVTQMELKAQPYGTDFESGVNGEAPLGRWTFGGNISANGGALEMWTKYDNIIVATTEAEVLAFLGVSVTNPQLTCQANDTSSSTSYPFTADYTIESGRTEGPCTWESDQGPSGTCTATGGNITGTATGLSGTDLITVSLEDSEAEEGNCNFTVTYTAPGGATPVIIGSGTPVTRGPGTSVTVGG